MTSILVTGGTGTLGRPTVARLRAAGHDVRVLSRKRGPDRVIGDLSSGSGLPAAVVGSRVVVHLATSLGRRDSRQAHNLVQVLPPKTHLVVMSIVGIDRSPIGYYRTKLAVERMAAESGVPYTILRATQFHNLVDRIFTVQRFLPVLLAPPVPLQPIAVEDVAVRLTELVHEPPVNGRAPDIGGPEVRTVPELAELWVRARRSKRSVVSLRVPGKIFREFANGAALVDGTPYGRISFGEYLG